MASINIIGSPSTFSNNLTITYTTDADNISNIEISKDGVNYIAATTFTNSSATFDVSSWGNGNYSCSLRVTYLGAITYTMELKTSEASTFNDVNNDGLGEFQGWGTSLCWWANRLGYNKNLINQAVQRFYSESGLNLNIGRYNIGGGEHVKYAFDTPYYIDVNNKTRV